MALHAESDSAWSDVVATEEKRAAWRAMAWEELEGGARLDSTPDDVGVYNPALDMLRQAEADTCPLFRPLADA